MQLNMRIVKQIAELNEKIEMINKKLYECIDCNNAIQFSVFYEGHKQLKNQLEHVAKCGHKYPEIESYAIKCNLV